MQFDASLFLQIADDAEEVARLRIPALTEHPHKALRLCAGRGAKLLETNGYLKGFSTIGRYNVIAAPVATQ